MMIRLLVGILLCLPSASGYLNFAKQLPNGDKVPHPCKPNVLWEGVGHFQVAGGGQRNPFGKDFYEAGKTWTQDLCRKDSDGDGRTNGQELGDPNCTWRPNTRPEVTSGLSHPGICEPYDSAACKQRALNSSQYSNQSAWMVEACKDDVFVCEGLNASDVKSVDMRFPKTLVPSDDTTYICTLFEFPEPNSDVHMIATTPILDNKQIMHHSVFFGCTGEVNDRAVGVPYKCSVTAHQNCSAVISVWAVGLAGDCHHGHAGIRLGANGYKKFAIQQHWNNPEKVTNYTDSSGMTLYYTANKRVNDAGVWVVGSNDFVIPPHQDDVAVKATCRESCTRNIIKDRVFITSAWNHMHYMGFGASLEHFRNGTRLRYITNEDDYSYDSPKVSKFQSPIEVLPGDELYTTCHFRSTYKDRTTPSGEATHMEMCVVFAYYYPRQALADENCNSQRSINFCEAPEPNGCNASRFFQKVGQLSATVNDLCVPYECYTECKAAIKEARRTEPCLTDKGFMTFFKKWRFSETEKGIATLAKLQSCDVEIYMEENAVSPLEPNPSTGDGTRETTYPPVWGCVTTAPENPSAGKPISGAGRVGASLLPVAAFAILLVLAL